MTNKKVAVISSNSNTYTGRGKEYMDKSSHQNQELYHFGKQTIIVERRHTGDKTVRDIIKQCVHERILQMAKLDEFDDQQYNDSCNKAVVTLTKEGKK